MSNFISDDYFFKFWQKKPLGKIDREELFALSYPEVVALAQNVVLGSVDGNRFGLKTGFPTSPPGQPMPDGKKLRQIQTQKLLVSRKLQVPIMRHFGEMAPAKIRSAVDIRGWSRIETLRKSGKPIVFLNSHFGPALLVPLFLERFGFSVVHFGALDILGSFRLEGYKNLEWVPTSSTFSAQLVAIGVDSLKSGDSIHLTGDGLTGSSAQLRPFLGKQRPVPEGAPYMAIVSGAAVVPTFLSIGDNGALTLQFCEPLWDIGGSFNRQERMDAMIQEYLHLLESRWLGDFGNVPRGLFKQHLAMADTAEQTVS